MAVCAEPCPLSRQAYPRVAPEHSIRKESIRIAADRIAARCGEAEVILADRRQDAGDAERAAEFLVHRRRRSCGVDADLPQQAMDRNLACWRIEQDLACHIRKSVVVGPETGAAGNLQDGFGVLEPHRPLPATARCGRAERLGPANLGLSIENLTDRTA